MLLAPAANAGADIHRLCRSTSSGVLPHPSALGVKGKQACMQAYVTMHALLTFTQMPQPMQSSSEIQAILAVEDTSIHSLPAQSSLFIRQAQLALERTLRAFQQAGLTLQVTMAAHLFSPQDSSFCILAGTSLAYTCATKEHLNRCSQASLPAYCSLPIHACAMQEV